MWLSLVVLAILDDLGIGQTPSLFCCKSRLDVLLADIYKGPSLNNLVFVLNILIKDLFKCNCSVIKTSGGKSVSCWLKAEKLEG